MNIGRKLLFLAMRSIFIQTSKYRINVIYGCIYDLAGSPNTADYQWGEHHFFDDKKIFIQALYLSGVIDSYTKKRVKIVENEDSLQTKSHFYELEGRSDLDKGQISYINGLSTPLCQAQWDAYRFSDNLCNRRQIHGVYNPTHGYYKDLINTLHAQNGTLFKVNERLLKQWCHFFQHNHHEIRYLQICFSQGVAIVNATLNQLPPEYRKRICVIAIAPAILIPPNPDCQVMHFVKKSDTVPNLLTTNRHRLNREDKEIIIVPEDDSTIHPHDPHGMMYQKAIQPYISSYISSNTMALL